MKPPAKTPEPRENLELFHDWLDVLADSRFWGTLVITFQNGAAIHARREESLRPHQIAQELGTTQAEKIGKQVACESNPNGANGADR